MTRGNLISVLIGVAVISITVDVGVFPNISHEVKITVLWIASGIAFTCIIGAVILVLLPEKKVNCPKDLIHVEEAVHYVCNESRWAFRLSLSIKNDLDAALLLPYCTMKFPDKAEKGVITIWGLDNSGNHVAIPATYWLSGMIDIESVVKGKWSHTIPRPTLITKAVPSYINLVVSKAAVINAWPKAGIIFKSLMRLRKLLIRR